MKFRPLTWRQAHPYLLADRCAAPRRPRCRAAMAVATGWRRHVGQGRLAGWPAPLRPPHPTPTSTPLALHPWRRFEDITPAEAVRANPRCDRDVTLYGYVRGCNWKEGSRVHIAGVGDYPVRGRGVWGVGVWCCGVRVGGGGGRRGGTTRGRDVSCSVATDPQRLLDKMACRCGTPRRTLLPCPQGPAPTPPGPPPPPAAPPAGGRGRRAARPLPPPRQAEEAGPERARAPALRAHERCAPAGRAPLSEPGHGPCRHRPPPTCPSPRAPPLACRPPACRRGRPAV